MSTPRLIRDPGAEHLSRLKAFRFRLELPKGPAPPLREPPLRCHTRMLAALASPSLN